MKNFVVILLIITMVSSNPIKDQGINPDETTLNRQFFDNIFKTVRISRDTNDEDVIPTIALHDLINSVEQTLIHSAQNLAASNITANLTTTVADTDAKNVTTVQQNTILIPIAIPTPAPVVTNSDDVTESLDETTFVEDELVRERRPNDTIVSEHKETDFETIKPIEHSNLGIIFPMSLNPSANISHVVTEEEENVPVTEETKNANQPDVTIIKHINSTQVVPTESDVVHLHQQQITIFSANAGIFPNIHAVKAEDLPVLAETSSVQPELEDCSGEEASSESSEANKQTNKSSESSEAKSEETSDSSSSSDEKEKEKKPTCNQKSSAAVLKVTEVTTPSVKEVKKTKMDELKEKIAEVEADPVILTQGI